MMNMPLRGAWLLLLAVLLVDAGCARLAAKAKRRRDNSRSAPTAPSPEPAPAPRPSPAPSSPGERPTRTGTRFEDSWNDRLEERLAGLETKSKQGRARQESWSSAAGKLALAHTVTEWEEAQRAAALAGAWTDYQKECWEPQIGNSWFRFDMTPVADVSEQALAPLRDVLGEIADSLPTKHPVQRSLRSALQREHAAEAVYVDHLARFVRADPLRDILLRLLERQPDGSFLLAEERRSDAEQRVARSIPLIDALQETSRLLGERGQQLRAGNAQQKRLGNALADPLFAALMTLPALQDSPSLAELPAKVVEQTAARLKQAGPEGVAKLLDRFEQVRPRVRALKMRAEGLVRRIPDSDSLHRNLRKLLSSELILWILAQKSQSVAWEEAFRKRSRLGRALVKTQTGWNLNPYRQVELHQLAQRIHRILDDQQRLHSWMTQAADGASGDLAKGLRSPLVQVAMAQALGDEVQVHGIDPLAGWWDQHMHRGAGGDEPLPTATAAVAEVSRTAERFARNLSANETPVTVDWADADFSREYVHLFESSAFHGFRTNAGTTHFLRAFDSYDTARLWGVFSWDAHTATDMKSFLANLHARRPSMEAMARLHDKIIIILDYTPDWLRRTDNMEVFEGHWKYCNAQRPKDWNVWGKMVQETVKFVESFGVPSYFEVWNEPEAYWKEGGEEYLELYERTVRSIREVSSTAKVGGAAPNYWNGKVEGDRDLINLELLRFVGRKKLPMDFISWHYFGGPLSDLKRAKDTFHSAWKKAGIRGEPEYLITEWNVPYRLKGTPWATLSFAEIMLGFYEAELDCQTFSAWEEFNAEPPIPNGFGPYGIITQQGVKKPIYHVHKYYSELAHESRGVAVFTSSDGAARVVMSKEGGNEFDLLLWEKGYEPPVRAALQALKDHGWTAEDVGGYGDAMALEDAIAGERALKRSHRDALKAAATAYRNEPNRHNRLQLEFPGAKQIRVLDAEAVFLETRRPVIVTSGSRLVSDLRKNEVMWMRVRIE